MKNRIKNRSCSGSFGGQKAQKQAVFYLTAASYFFAKVLKLVIASAAKQSTAANPSSVRWIAASLRSSQ